MRAVIFASGVIEDYSYIDKESVSDALVICADGGYEHALKLGIHPDVIVGDSDSIKSEYPDDGRTRIIRCPAEKDYTDTNKCIDVAIEDGCTDVEIYGGLGGRFDHEYSNICLMAYALEKGVRVKLVNMHNEIWMEKTGFCLHRGSKKYVSFFPYGGAVDGFSVRGLKYSAENMRLECHLAQASSNEFAECDIADIDFKSGTLIVMLCDDAK